MSLRKGTTIISGTTGPIGPAGRGVTITHSRNADDDGTVVVITYDDGTGSVEFTIPDGEDGAHGDAGRGITSIDAPANPGQPGATDTYTINYTDSTTSTFEVRNGNDGTNGDDGQGIASIVAVDQPAMNQVQVTITFTNPDGATTLQPQVFTIPHGNGITDISRTSGDGSAGTTDTYTITYNDSVVGDANTFDTFTVYNGRDGDNAAGTVTRVRGTGDVNGITLTGDGTDDVTLTLGGTLSIDYTTNVITNKPTTITQAQTDKLAGIEAGAEVNVNADWDATSGDAEILNKPTTITDAQAQAISDNSAKRSYPQADENKLAGIAAGAEVNVQSNWTETDTNADSFILNKPTLAPSNAEANVQSDWDETDTASDAFILNKPTTITQDQTNKLAGIAAGAEVNVNADWDATSGDAEILNKPTTITDAQAQAIMDNSAKRSYPQADETKLAGIAAGAEVNVQADWRENDSDSDSYIQNKPSSIVTDVDVLNDHVDGSAQLRISKFGENADELTLMGGTNISLTETTEGDNGVITIDYTGDTGGQGPFSGYSITGTPQASDPDSILQPANVLKYTAPDELTWMQDDAILRRTDYFPEAPQWAVTRATNTDEPLVMDTFRITPDRITNGNYTFDLNVYRAVERDPATDPPSGDVDTIGAEGTSVNLSLIYRVPQASGVQPGTLADPPAFIFFRITRYRGGQTGAAARPITIEVLDPDDLESTATSTSYPENTQSSQIGLLQALGHASFTSQDRIIEIREFEERGITVNRDNGIAELNSMGYILNVNREDWIQHNEQDVVQNSRQEVATRVVAGTVLRIHGPNGDIEGTFYVQERNLYGADLVSEHPGALPSQGSGAVGIERRYTFGDLIDFAPTFDGTLGLKLFREFVNATTSGDTIGVRFEENYIGRVSGTVDVSSKQNLINAANRLNADLIADGTVSNTEFQQLNDINTDETIQTQIDGKVDNIDQATINLDATTGQVIDTLVVNEQGQTTAATLRSLLAGDIPNIAISQVDNLAAALASAHGDVYVFDDDTTALTLAEFITQWGAGTDTNISPTPTSSSTLQAGEVVHVIDSSGTEDIDSVYLYVGDTATFGTDTPNAEDFHQINSGDGVTMVNADMGLETSPAAGITGTGTVRLTQASIDSLALADSALQPEDVQSTIIGPFNLDGTDNPLAVNPVESGAIHTALAAKADQVFVEDTVLALDADDVPNSVLGVRAENEDDGALVSFAEHSPETDQVAILLPNSGDPYINIQIDNNKNDLVIPLANSNAGRNIYASINNGRDVVFVGTLRTDAGDNGASDRVRIDRGTNSQADLDALTAAVGVGDELWIANVGVGIEETYLTDSYTTDIRGDLRVRDNFRLGGIPDVEAAIDSIPNAISQGSGIDISVDPDDSNVDIISLDTNVFVSDNRLNILVDELYDGRRVFDTIEQELYIWEGPANPIQSDNVADNWTLVLTEDNGAQLDAENTFTERNTFDTEIIVGDREGDSVDINDIAVVVEHGIVTDADHSAMSMLSSGLIFPDGSIQTSSGDLEFVFPAVAATFADTGHTIDGAFTVFTGFEYNLNVTLATGADVHTFSEGDNIRFPREVTVDGTATTIYTEAVVLSFTPGNTLTEGIIAVRITGGTSAIIEDDAPIELLSGGTAARVERITSIRNNDSVALNTVTGELVISGDGNTAYVFQPSDDNGAVLGVNLQEQTGTVTGTVNTAVLFNATASAETANAVTTTAERTYSVQLDSNNRAVVNIPWLTSRTGGNFDGELNFTSIGGGSQETNTNTGNTFTLNIVHADGWSYNITNATVSRNTDIFLTNIPAGGQTVRVINNTGAVGDTTLHVTADITDPDGTTTTGGFTGAVDIHVRPFHAFGGSLTYDPAATQVAADGGNSFEIGINHTSGWTYQITSATSDNNDFSATIAANGQTVTSATNSQIVGTANIRIRANTTDNNGDSGPEFDMMATVTTTRARNNYYYGGTNVEVTSTTTLADLTGDLTEASSPEANGERLSFTTTSGERVTFLVDQDYTFSSTDFGGFPVNYALVSDATITGYNVYQSGRQGGGTRDLIITIS